MQTPLEALEEFVLYRDIITRFETRGWALYRCDDEIDSLLELKDIVEAGRETESLREGRFILLPLNEDDRNWPLIRDMVFMLMSQGRGPYFMEMIEGRDENNERWVEPIARFLVDSVRMDFPDLVLTIDHRFTKVKDPKMVYKGEIHIAPNELYKLNQLQMSIRKI